MISSDAKWSSSSTSVRRTPSTAATASYASATIRKAKFGAQKYVGSRSRTCTSPSSDTVHDETKPSAVTGSSSSGSRTASNAASTLCLICHTLAPVLHERGVVLRGRCAASPAIWNSAGTSMP